MSDEVTRLQERQTIRQWKEKTTELTGVIYEEPVAVAPVETVFSLSDNQAYGQPVAVAPVETVFSLSDNQAYGQVK